MTIKYTIDEGTEQFKHKLYTKSVWATKDQLQAEADKMNISVDELIHKLQSIFHLVGDECKN